MDSIWLKFEQLANKNVLTTLFFSPVIKRRGGQNGREGSGKDEQVQGCQVGEQERSGQEHTVALRSKVPSRGDS